MLAACTPTFLIPNSPAPEATKAVHSSINYVAQQVQPELEIVSVNQEVSTDNSTTAPIQKNQVQRTSSLNWFSIYFIGLGAMLLILGIRIFILFRLHLRSTSDEGLGYHLLPASASDGQAFTFGRAIYFSQDVTLDPDFDHILAHEQVHARQLHSLDILLSELFLCALWFHPFAWWTRAKLRANLEFLVDKAVIKSSSNKREYQLALVRQSQYTQGLALALPFSEPSLKSRITRMTGMPKHWLVGILATVGLIFWMGVVALVIGGNLESGESLNGDGFHSKIGNETAQSTLYDSHFKGLLPKELTSFELYFRRLPTPEEYLQIRAILMHIPHTNFSIYQPCEEKEGLFTMQINHFSKKQATLPTLLSEVDRINDVFVFSLTERVTSQPIPTDLPLNSFGYYAPAITLLDQESLPMKIKSTSVMEGEIAIFVNGNQIPLIADLEYRIEGKRLSGFSEMGKYISMPPREQMACILGFKDNNNDILRNSLPRKNNPKSHIKAFLYHTTYLSEYKFYVDDQLTTPEEIMKMDFTGNVLTQEGWIQNSAARETVYQIITDSYWR
jgi:beta-lactamase regulating signal transducer with metallopeptidase domain